MSLSSDEINELIGNPQLSAEKANLIYTSENDLCINRQKRGKGYQYLKDGEPVESEVAERIKKMVIPPAWKDVKICPHDKGHLQVVGVDAKHRKQYMYHPDWSRIRNQTKFYKMAVFGKVLPNIRAQVEKDLRMHGMPRQKVLALVIRLMEETHIRIGNEAYARENKSYGLSTLRSKHIDISKGKLQISFIGKRGIEHHVSVSDKRLVKLVNQCEEIPGWEVFKYFDEDGNKQSIDSGMVNEYIHKTSDDFFSAKDFRTWSATKIFFESLCETGYVKEEKENKSNILKAFDTAAEALGNTRSVCRSYYVHPVIVEFYKTGDIVPYLEKIKKVEKHRYPDLSETEQVILEIIEFYEITLNTGS